MDPKINLELLGLARKLAAEWHLNVADRRLVPNTGLPASALLAAIAETLATGSTYPPGWPPDEPAYDGAVITSSDSGYTVYERHEIGMMRFSAAAITPVASLAEAVQLFLQATFRGDVMDGIQIDWSC